MIKKIWSGRNKLYWLLLPFSLLYGGVSLIRRRLYKWGILKSWQAPIPVIIVGNLSVGGNGKTPLVIYLIEQLSARGYRVGVVSRGYGSHSMHYPLIVTDQISTDQAGDEPYLIYQRTHVPLAIAPKRVEAVKQLITDYPLDIIIADDGLQHYALQRKIEIAVIDGKNGFGNGWWLPAGPMRETAKRLKSVDVIVTNGKLQVPISLPNNIPIFNMQLKPAKAINLLTGEQRDIKQLKHIHALAGIGYPERFFTMLQAMGINIEKQYPFPDHHAFTPQQLLPLADETQVLLMTEKDAVKCHAFALANWWYVPVDAQLDEHFIDNICKKLNS
jgi:tetraacyldisaccharide 4'-kinase